MGDFLLDLLGAFVMSLTLTAIFLIILYFAGSVALLDVFWLEPEESPQVWTFIRFSWGVVFGCSLTATFLPREA